MNVHLCKDCRYRNHEDLMGGLHSNECRHKMAIKVYDYVRENHKYCSCNEFRRKTRNKGGCGFKGYYFKPSKFKMLKDKIRRSLYNKDFFHKRIGRPAR